MERFIDYLTTLSKTSVLSWRQQMSGFAPWVMAFIQKQHSVLFGAIANRDTSTWSNDAERGEAGQHAAWLCAQHLIW
jgi:hypothetical protein